jgi:HEPN domain-containing protein
MSPLSREWVAKAEGDYTVARRELRARKAPNYDAACFHAQQCAEKYLKARLQEAGISFPKTHDLSALLDLVLPVEPAWAGLRTDAHVLSDVAVEVRYPGLFAGREQAKDAVRRCDAIRLIARASLGL